MSASFSRVSRLALGATTLAVAASGCGSNSISPGTGDDGTGTSAFNGSWKCTTTSTYTVTSPAGYPPYTGSTSSNVEIDISSGGTLMFETGGADGGPGCSSSWTTSGDRATLVPDEGCMTSFVSDGINVAVDGKYTSGTGSVMGTTMRFQLSATFTGTLAKGALTVALSGTYAGSSTCTQ